MLQFQWELLLRYLNANPKKHIRWSYHEGKLLTIDQVPAYLRHNPYIQSGYRKKLSFGQCLKSAFEIHNETINIWSHLIGLFIFFGLMLYDNWVALPNSGATLSDHLIVTAGLLCFQFCMAASVIYHLFMCHKASIFSYCLWFDTMGICVAIFGCYFPALYLSFPCHPVWARVYLFTIMLFILFLALLLWRNHHRAHHTIYSPNNTVTSANKISGQILSTFPETQSTNPNGDSDGLTQSAVLLKGTSRNCIKRSNDAAKFQENRRKSSEKEAPYLLPLSQPEDKRLISISLFVLVSAFGCIPAIHWVALHGGWRSALVLQYIPKLAIVYSICLAALTFYLTKFPERLLPGQFDLIGSSHQFWHLLVTVLLLYTHQIGAELYYDHKLAKCR